MKINGSPRSVSTGQCERIPIGLALAAGFCLAAPALFSSPAKAQASCNPDYTECTIDLITPINGASPLGSQPWLSLQITDSPSGGVSILFKPSLSPSEFISKVGLNLTDDSRAGLLTGLTATCVAGESSPTICSNFDPSKDFVATLNGYSVEGAAVAGFDLGFDLPLSNNGGRLTNGKVAKFNLSGTALKTADLLGIINVKGVKVSAAAKVQGIGPQDLSGAIAADPNGTDVPGPLPILGAAAAFQASRRLRRRLKPTTLANPGRPDRRGRAAAGRGPGCAA